RHQRENATIAVALATGLLDEIASTAAPTASGEPAARPYSAGGSTPSRGVAAPRPPAPLSRSAGPWGLRGPMVGRTWGLRGPMVGWTWGWRGPMVGWQGLGEGANVVRLG